MHGSLPTILIVDPGFLDEAAGYFFLARSTLYCIVVNPKGENWGSPETYASEHEQEGRKCHQIWLS